MSWSCAPTAQSAAPKGFHQLGFESSPNHLASVAAGPTGEFKTCSSRWKDRQCTICPGTLHVTEPMPGTNELAGSGRQILNSIVSVAVLSLPWHLMHCNYLTVTCLRIQHDLFDGCIPQKSYHSHAGIKLAA